MALMKWGIIGGGIMGLTLADRLIKQGHKVTIFESAPDLGGLASSWKLGNVEWDKFYHVILLSDFRTRNMLKDVTAEENSNPMMRRSSTIGTGLHMRAEQALENEPLTNSQEEFKEKENFGL